MPPLGEGLSLLEVGQSRPRVLADLVPGGHLAGLSGLRLALCEEVDRLHPVALEFDFTRVQRVPILRKRHGCSPAPRRDGTEWDHPGLIGFAKRNPWEP